MYSVARQQMQTVKSPWKLCRIVCMISRHDWGLIISVFVETGLVVMFGRPELFNECLVALWPPGVLNRTNTSRHTLTAPSGLTDKVKGQSCWASHQLVQNAAAGCSKILQEHLRLPR